MVGRNQFRGRKSNFSVTALKKSSNPGEINESLRKLRGLVIDLFLKFYLFTPPSTYLTLDFIFIVEGPVVMVWVLNILYVQGLNLNEPTARRPAFGRLLAAAHHVCERTPKKSEAWKGPEQTKPTLRVVGLKKAQGIGKSRNKQGPR